MRYHLDRLVVSSLLAAPFTLSAVASADAPPKEPSAIAPSDEGAAHKHEEAELEVTIRPDPPEGDAASRVTFGRRDLELRPRLRPGDVLEAVPGLFAVQHAGGGKANQYFLRGFDADHGTDVAFSVDGVPVNMVSHGHGQGFTDFHFLIPELVVGLDGYKGPYYANMGDFATAGAVNLRLAESFEESFASFGAGQYGIMRGLVIASPALGDTWRAVIAAELYKDDGPFQNPEDLKRFNVFARVTHDLDTRSHATLTWMSYGSSWNGSGQIPARAVCGEGEANNAPPDAFGAQCIDHFGSVDPTEGGATQRHMASLAYSTSWDNAELSALMYLVRYRFALYSNFTFFADDPVQGDQIEQYDDRVVAGGDLRLRTHFHYGDAKFTSSVGAQVRADSIDNALYHDKARERLSTKVASAISESEIGLYFEEDARLNRYLRFVLGLRGDRIDVGVEDKLEDYATNRGKTSGVAGAMKLSPKVMAVVTPIPILELFADYGRGFHSNDARGAVRQNNPVTLITEAIGYEVGARVKPIKNLELRAAAFLMDLDSELVWSGDAGTTEASAPTRRYGVEIGGRYQIGNWLFADADATFANARYRSNAGNGDAVALAPTRTFSGGVGARPTFGDFTPFASVRVKSIGDRPAIEDASLTAEGFTTVDANAGLRWKRVEVGVDVQNLFNATWREVNFANESRLPYEPAPVTGIHYSPGWPMTVMGRATLYWR